MTAVLLLLLFSGRPAGGAEADFEFSEAVSENGREYCLKPWVYRPILGKDGRIIACRRSPPRTLLKTPDGKYAFVSGCLPGQREAVTHSPLPGDKTCLGPDEGPRLWSKHGADDELDDCPRGQSIVVTNHPRMGDMACVESPDRDEAGMAVLLRCKKEEYPIVVNQPHPGSLRCEKTSGDEHVASPADLAKAPAAPKTDLSGAKKTVDVLGKSVAPQKPLPGPPPVSGAPAPPPPGGGGGGGGGGHGGGGGGGGAPGGGSGAAQSPTGAQPRPPESNITVRSRDLSPDRQVSLPGLFSPFAAIFGPNPAGMPAPPSPILRQPGPSRPERRQPAAPEPLDRPAPPSPPAAPAAAPAAAGGGVPSGGGGGWSWAPAPPGNAPAPETTAPPPSAKIGPMPAPSATRPQPPSLESRARAAIRRVLYGAQRVDGSREATRRPEPFARDGEDDLAWTLFMRACFLVGLIFLLKFTPLPYLLGLKRERRSTKRRDL